MSYNNNGMESINDKDVVIGIAASGSTPYVIGALEACNKKNIKVNLLGNENGNEFKNDSKNKKINGNEMITQSILQNKSDNSKVENTKEITKNENLQIKIPENEFLDYIPEAINKIWSVRTTP